MANVIHNLKRQLKIRHFYSDPGPERGDLPEGFVPVTISEQFIKHPSIGLGNAGRYTCRAKNEVKF